MRFCFAFTHFNEIRGETSCYCLQYTGKRSARLSNGYGPVPVWSGLVRSIVWWPLSCIFIWAPPCFEGHVKRRSQLLSAGGFINCWLDSNRSKKKSLVHTKFINLLIISTTNLFIKVQLQIFLIWTIPPYSSYCV